MYDRILSNRRPGASARQRPPGMVPLDWQVQREWTSLHERLRPEPARPGSADAPAADAQTAEAPTAELRATAASTPVQAAPRSQPGWTVGERLVAAGLVLVALMLVGFARLQGDGVQRAQLRERIDHLAVQQEHDRARATERAARQDQRQAAFASQVHSLIRPPLAYQHGRELLSAGRWADAEAAFGPLLYSGIPDALRADVLKMSAQANAMAGNCNLMASRLTALKRIAPGEPVLRKRDELMRRCVSDRQSMAIGLAGSG